jgi:hypothetical protein
MATLLAFGGRPMCNCVAGHIRAGQGGDMIRTVADLAAHTAAGRPVEYLFFWGHRPHPSGQLGPSCLSQWWPAPSPYGDRSEIRVRALRKAMSRMSE